MIVASDVMMAFCWAELSLCGPDVDLCCDTRLSVSVSEEGKSPSPRRGVLWGETNDAPVPPYAALFFCKTQNSTQLKRKNLER